MKHITKNPEQTLEYFREYHVGLMVIIIRVD